MDNLLKNASPSIAELGMKDFFDKIEIVKHFVENIFQGKPFMIVNIVSADDDVLPSSPVVFPADPLVVYSSRNRDMRNLSSFRK